MAAVYLDSSALVKLAVREPESTALRRHLRRRLPWVSSALARTEVLRELLPMELSSLDALHLATARRLAGELGELVTYDEPMAGAARALGHRVAASR